MRITLMMLLAAVTGWAQVGGVPPRPAAVGTISGMVRDGDRKPMAGVLVVVTPDPGDRGSVTPYQGQAVTKADGSYEVTKVPEGSYWVCPQVPLSDYLNPCQWDVNAPTAKVGGGGGAVTAKQDVTMAKGSFLWVQVEDPDGWLDKHRGGRGQFRLGVRSPRGEYELAAPPMHARGRKLYRILVPKQGKFQPVREGEDFVVEHGAAAARGASPFGVEAELGAGERRVLIVNVRGGK